MSNEIELQPTEIESAPIPDPAIEAERAAAQVQALMQQAEEQAFSRFLTVLQGAIKKPKAEPEVERSRVPAPELKREESRITGYGDVVDAREHLYRRLPAELRKHRDPLKDAQMARWIRAMAFKNDAATLIEWEKRDTEMLKRADLLEGTTTATSGLSGGTAGPLIPLPLHNQIILLRDRAAALRPYCRVVTSPSLTLRVPVGGVATAEMAAEGAIAGQGEPTNTSILLHKKKMQFTAQASEESLMDSAFNVVSYFTERAGSAFGQLEDVQICTSDGSAPDITGSLETPNANSAGAQTITAFAEASAGTLTYEDVLGIWFAVGKQYRRGAIWMGSATMCRILSQILDSNGRPVFAPASNAGAPVGDSSSSAIGQIFGNPVVEVPLTATNLFFGDMSYYMILEGERMAMKSTDAVSWSADTIDFKITSRWDGALANTTAFRVCAGITAAG